MYSLPQVLPPWPDLIVGPPGARAQLCQRAGGATEPDVRAQLGTPPESHESQGESQEQDHLEMEINNIVYKPLALRISRKCIFFLCLSSADLPTHTYLWTIVKVSDRNFANHRRDKLYLKQDRTLATRKHENSKFRQWYLVPAVTSPDLNGVQVYPTIIV